MAKIKSYSDLQQSKKLAEILPLESADMVYTITNGYHTPWVRIEKIDELDKDDVCAWSLATLLDVLPQFIEFKDNKYYLRLMKEYVEYADDEISITGRCLHTAGNNNLVDACYEMILKLNELKLL